MLIFDRQINEVLKKRLINDKIDKIWWVMVKELFISEYQELKNDKKILENDKEIESLVPFKIQVKNERTSLVMNDKLDESEINKIFGSVNIFYENIAIMLYKYITQDLPIWLSSERGFAKDFIPFGKFFGLLLTGIEKINDVTSSKRKVLDSIYHDINLNDETIEFSYRYNSDGDRLDDAIYDKDTLFIESLKDSTDELEITNLLSLEEKNYLIKKFICNENDRQFELFSIFLGKFYSLINNDNIERSSTNAPSYVRYLLSNFNYNA